MLLWLSSGGEGLLGAGEGFVDLAGDVAFETAYGVLCGQSVVDSFVAVCAGVGAGCESGAGEDVEGSVGLAVAASAEAVAVGFAGAGGDGCDAAEGGERGF